MLKILLALLFTAGLLLNAAEPEIRFSPRGYRWTLYRGTFPIPLRHLLILNSDGAARSQRFADALADLLRATNEFSRITVAAPGWIQGENDLPVDLLLLVSATVEDDQLSVAALSRFQPHTMQLQDQAGVRGGALLAHAAAVPLTGNSEKLLANDFVHLLRRFGRPALALPADLVDLLTPEFSGPETVDWPEELPFELVYSAAGPGRSSESLYRIRSTPEAFPAVFEAAQKHFAGEEHPGLVLVADSSAQGKLETMPAGMDRWCFLRLVRPADTDQLLLDELVRRRLESSFMFTLKDVYPPEKVAALLADDAFLAEMPGTALVSFLSLEFSPRVLQVAWRRRNEFASGLSAHFLRLAEEHGVTLPEAEVAEFLGPEIGDDSEPVELVLGQGQPDLRWHRREGSVVIIGAAAWLPEPGQAILISEITRTPGDNTSGILSRNSPGAALRHWSAAAGFDDEGARLTIRPRGQTEAVTVASARPDGRPEFEREIHIAFPTAADFFPPLRNVLILTDDDAEWTRQLARAAAEELRRDYPDISITTALPGWIQPPGAAAPDLVLVVGTPLDESPTPEGYLTRIIFETGVKTFRPGVPGQPEQCGGYWRITPVRYLCSSRFTDAERQSAAQALAGLLLNPLRYISERPLPPDLADLVIPEFSGPELLEWPEELPFKHLYSAAAPGSSSENVYRLAAPVDRFGALAEEARMVFYARPDNDGWLLAADLPPGSAGTLGVEHGGDVPFPLRLNRTVELRETLLAALAERGLQAQYLSPLLCALPVEQQEQLLADQEFLDAAGIRDLSEALYVLGGDLRIRFLRYLWSRRREADLGIQFSLIYAAHLWRIPLPAGEVAEIMGPELAPGAEPLRFVLSQEQPAARWHIDDDYSLILNSARFTGDGVEVENTLFLVSPTPVLTADSPVYQTQHCRVRADFEDGTATVTVSRRGN